MRRKGTPWTSCSGKGRIISLWYLEHDKNLIEWSSIVLCRWIEANFPVNPTRIKGQITHTLSRAVAQGKLIRAFQGIYKPVSTKDLDKSLSPNQASDIRRSRSGKTPVISVLDLFPKLPASTTDR